MAATAVQRRLATAASAGAASRCQAQRAGSLKLQLQTARAPGLELGLRTSLRPWAGRPQARFCSDAPAKRQPVDTTTAIDEHRKLKRVERRIQEHKREQQGTQQLLEGTGDAPPSPPGAGASEASAVMPQSGPLRIVDPNAVVDDSAEKEIIVRSRTTTGQVLWPATEEDIAILSESKLLYPAPYEVEGSVIIRLVRLSDPVTSPVSRVIRNRQFGIRGNEKWQLLAMGAISALFVYGLAFWQLKRMEWKQNLIEMRRTRLAMPRVEVKSSPFPWKDQVEDYVYRIVDVRGVYNHRREMLVGPRPGTDDSGNTTPGFLVVTPLTLEDGSTILVNRGHIPIEKVDPIARPELPVWVRVRGVLEEGEIPNLVGQYARLKNRPDRNQFGYLVAEDLAENSGARNHRECSQAVVTAYDVLYEDDFQTGKRRPNPFSMRHKEDYLLFWADEHTHFNYAMQWFGLGSLIFTMTVYKFIEVSRWKF